MLALVRSAAVLGIDAYAVDVETDIANGLPSFATVGLPHGAVREGRERVNAAIANSGFQFPLKRITVNLAPADIRKEGSAFDLPIAVGILVATGQIGGHGPSSDDVAGGLGDSLLVGELGLEGDVRPVRGALCIAVGARRMGCRRLILPAGNLDEVTVVEGLEVRGAARLADLVAFLEGRGALPGPVLRARPARPPDPGVDFSEVRGQQCARRALEIGAAGAHNVLMVGPPGSGKTMLARRLATILPSMTREEALETTKIHSVAGLLPTGGGLLGTRPFRAPHHTISDAGLIGGGSHPRPGEVSLAHGGVLFLDELPEFRKSVLEVLRQPLEDGEVTISRAAMALSFPARFVLAAAMNPCPCGFAGAPDHRCACSPVMVDRYRSRISGPLLDRIDLHVHVPAVPRAELSDRDPAESSEAIRRRAERARERQRQRFEGRPDLFANGHMGPRDLGRFCAAAPAALQLLDAAIPRLRLSARAYHRILKIARTIADLAGSDRVRKPHVAEAIQYRTLDRMRP